MQENVRQRLQHHCQEIFNKISFQEIFSVAGNILQDIFVILYTGMPYNFTPCLQKRFASRDFPPQLFITMCGAQYVLSTYAGSFISGVFCQEEKYIF